MLAYLPGSNELGHGKVDFRPLDDTEPEVSQYLKIKEKQQMR